MMTVCAERAFAERVLASKLLDETRLSQALADVNGDDEDLARHLIREGLLTRFQARQIMAGATGFHVDKYVVVDCIGRGGNGVVFKARHTLLANRYVALKTIDARDLHHSDEVLARFRREIDIVSRLDHPNVVRAYDVVRTRTQLYLVLEFIDGRDLGALVRERGPLPIAEAVDYTIQAARGLAYAHRCGIVHRDIKPGNLLLTRNNIVKLSDLGLARVYTHEADCEHATKGLCLGTPEFMAPEQAEDASRADARSDLYSLGATLFHMLTAELPVGGSSSSRMHLLQQLLTKPPKPLQGARADVPTGLATVVDRLRSRDPAMRPATADEVIVLLKPYRKYSPDGPQSWDGRRRAAFVLDVLTGKIPLVDGQLKHPGAPGLEELERWQQKFLEGAQQALDPNASNGESCQQKLHELHAKIGAQAMEIEELKRQLAAK
jgi:serine/threonine protein kinase